MNTAIKNRPSRSGSSTGRRSASHATRPFSKFGQRNGKSRTSTQSSSQHHRRGGKRGGGGNRARGGGGGRKMPTFNPAQFINTNPVDIVQEQYVPKHTFATFGVHEQIVKTIAEMGITTPSPIQDQIIPEILNGRDVIGLAETGTGKTAAFLIPLIENTVKDMGRQTLILAPTRELAIQIEAELKVLSKGFRLSSVTCVGGMNIQPQIRALKRPNHFVIGTPGRILDLINRRKFVPARLKTVVLDEADRMLDMGFINDIKKILLTTPKNRETLLFSATMDKATEKIVNDFLIDPVLVSVKKKDVTNSIEQDVVAYGHHDKYETLMQLLQDPDFKKVLVFGSMKHSVEKLSKELTASGFKSESIHGNKSHGQRQRSLSKFKQGESKILVATDVAARGIHVDNVSHVINYDLPNTFEDYVHRIGRTGRGSMRGKALTFVPTR